MFHSQFSNSLWLFPIYFATFWLCILYLKKYFAVNGIHHNSPLILKIPWNLSLALFISEISKLLSCIFCTLIDKKAVALCGAKYNLLSTAQTPSKSCFPYFHSYRLTLPFSISTLTKCLLSNGQSHIYLSVYAPDIYDSFSGSTISYTIFSFPVSISTITKASVFPGTRHKYLSLNTKLSEYLNIPLSDCLWYANLYTCISFVAILNFATCSACSGTNHTLSWYTYALLYKKSSFFSSLKIFMHFTSLSLSKSKENTPFKYMGEKYITLFFLTAAIVLNFIFGSSFLRQILLSFSFKSNIFIILFYFQAYLIPLCHNLQFPILIVPLEIL